MWMLLSLAAVAATYEAELAIPSQHPSWLPDDDPYGASRALYFAPGQANTVVNSGDPRVKCYVKNGWLQASFEATASNYPSSPFSTSSSYGGNTLEIDVVFMSSATDPSLQSRTIAPDNSVTIGRVEGAAMEKLFALPPCPAGYETGVVEASLPGVRCRVEQLGGKDYVRVMMSPSATMGNGTCVLPLNGPSTYTLTLHLSEAEI